MSEIRPPSEFRCGTAALVGRPNVGKSTLLNALLGWHLCIAGPRPQTTRHRILGILTRPHGQILFLDTPGLHRGGARAINRQLNRTARQAIAEADVAVQVVEAGRWTAEDTQVWNALDPARPRLLAVNKVDALKDKAALLPFIERIGAERAPDAVYLVSARRRDGLDELVRGILTKLPQNAAIYGDDELTDRSERFLAGEMVREQVMLRLAQELPYAATVEVTEFSEAEARAAIHATIWVEREGQKAIVIGAAGAQLKAIGSAARRAMEKAFGRRVHLQLWVRVRQNWSDDETMLKRFGYAE
ncbi:MAG: GTPase Era [Xanthomonadaceae bacterium]|nr:GTPase Era [Xanthomonadaceae bacterium]